MRERSDCISVSLVSFNETVLNMALLVAFLRSLENISKLLSYILSSHIFALTFQSASKEHLERSVEVVVTATLVFVAIRSAAGVFARRGGLVTSAKKVLLNRHLASFLSDVLQPIVHNTLLFQFKYLKCFFLIL